MTPTRSTGRSTAFRAPTTPWACSTARRFCTKADLDAEKLPATWPEVQAAAKKIAGLGNGTVGFAQYSAQNQGGWHFTASIYSQGGSVVSEDGKKAAVDTPEGKAVLQNLKDMRWRATTPWAPSSSSSSTTPSR
ncbi:hypothetical protein SMICM304S_04030 [Streptomyces microflavus]